MAEVQVYPLGHTNNLVEGRGYDVVWPSNYDGDLGDIENCQFFANPADFKYAGIYEEEFRNDDGVTWRFYNRGNLDVTWDEQDVDEPPPCFRERARGRNHGASRGRNRHASRSRNRGRRHRGGSRRSQGKKSRKGKTRCN
jgi:hypothetical protein